MRKMWKLTYDQIWCNSIILEKWELQGKHTKQAMVALCTSIIMDGNEDKI